MKSIEAVNKKNYVGFSNRLAVESAKKILFSVLSKMEAGHLVIEDQGEVYSFGQPVADGPLTARVKVLDQRVYSQVLWGGATGSGEAYMQGYWRSPDLVNVVRVFVLNQSVLQRLDNVWGVVKKKFSLITEWLRKNSVSGSKRNISAHYDLSNEFFSLFLDDTMMYSSAIFPEKSDDLAKASLVKLDHVCRRLNLSPDDHLLEIGTGWGGLAIYAAKHFGCRVTTTTISKEQYELAVARVSEAGLQDQVKVMLKDYRMLEGTFDKLVSIEMVEAVGHQYYKQFFAGCSRLLKPQGLMLMQAITTTDQRFEREKNTSDFIRKYIFPGGCLPSNEVVLRTTSKVTDMHLVGLEDITLDYAKTLKLWRERFFDRLEQVKRLGFDDTFVRMWEFYLAYCEGGFAERVINTSQFLFAKPLCRNLPSVGRDSLVY